MTLEMRDTIHRANRLLEALKAGNLLAVEEDYISLGKALRKMGYLD